MGAVAAVVEDTVGGVIDIAGDVVESVGAVVEDVAKVVVEVAVEVGNVVQAVIDDPLPVLIAVAGQAVGIPAPLTMGALTAARGGDLEDIALSMGTAYFAPTVGGAISSTVSEVFIEAGFNETFSQVASNSISKGLVNGTIAEIKGGDFEDGFAGGFTGGMVAGGVGEVASYVKPDIIEMALDNGLDLQDANALYNASTRAVSAGVTSEITGRNDFVTSFTNSAIGSGVDYGVRELNESIDEQFRTAATDWNEKDQGENPIDVSIVGQGIPNDVVSQVQVSDIGFNTTPDTIDTATVLADSQEARDVNNASSSYTGEKATSDISILPEPKLASDNFTLPEVQLADAPQGETLEDFSDLNEINQILGQPSSNLPTSDEVPPSVIDIAQEVDDTDAGVVEPQSALASVSEPSTSVDLSAIGDEAPTANAPPVVSEAPASSDLLTQGLPQETQAPTGGLNAMVEKTPEQKLAESQGLKPTDFTKPLVATVGNILKSTLRQGTKPPARVAPRPSRPTGGLQAMKAPTKQAAPPKVMDVSKLIPIQKAAPLQTAKATPVAPPKRLDKNAKLTPVQNIAGLTSLVKKTG